MIRHKDPLSDARVPKDLEIERYARARQTETTVLLNNLRDTFGEEKTGIQALPRALRRRTNAHNIRRYKKRPNVRKVEAKKRRIEETANALESSPEVKWENRKMRRRRSRLLAQLTDPAHAESVEKALALETHLWHAKRMTMTDLWGYKLAEGSFGKGAGSRSFYQKVEKHCAIHDASYMCPITIQGSQQALQALLSTTSDEHWESHKKLFWEGKEAAQCHLHHRDQFPKGCICPATLLVSGGEGQLTVWIWVHPAAMQEALSALRLASKDQELVVCSKQNLLSRIDIYGKRADDVVKACFEMDQARLEAIPEDLDSDSETSDPQQTLKCHARAWIASSFTGIDKAPGKASVHHLLVLDPRIAKPMTDTGQSCAHDFHTPDAEPHTLDTLVGALEKASSIPPALSEQAVSNLRCQSRKRARHAEASPQTSSITQIEISCPAVLLREISRSGLPCWTAILPRGWAKPFWERLVFSGATPAGQREWHWVAAYRNQASFPHNYLDTSSGAEFEMLRAANDLSERSLRPKGKFPIGAKPEFSQVGCGMRMGKQSVGLQIISSSSYEGDAGDRAQDSDQAMSESDPAENSSTTLLPQGAFIARTKDVAEQFCPTQGPVFPRKLETLQLDNSVKNAQSGQAGSSPRFHAKQTADRIAQRIAIRNQIGQSGGVEAIKSKTLASSEIGAINEPVLKPTESITPQAADSTEPPSIQANAASKPGYHSKVSIQSIDTAEAGQKDNDTARDGSGSDSGQPSKLCYVRCKLVFKGPGTAQWGAWVLTPEVRKEGDIEVDHNMREFAAQDRSAAAMKSSEDALSLEPDSVPAEPPSTKGIHTAGQKLVGYVTSGTLRGFKGIIHGTAMLRKDLMELHCTKQQIVGNGLGYNVLVQNPSSSVSHLAYAEIVF